MKKAQRIDLSNFKYLTNEVYYKTRNINSRYLIYYGGAGSGKSVWIAQKVIIDILTTKRNYLICRKVAKTSKNSTYAEIKGQINRMGLRSLFKFNESNLFIENKALGNKILFVGLDDVEKLKSITFEVGKLTNIWIEEASEISINDFQQLDLRLRGLCEYKKQIILSFNPVSALSWLKSYFFDRKNRDTKIIKTTYKDNKFLDEDYIKTLLDLKEKDITFYNIYALGDWGVLGNLVYNNYKIRKLETSPHLYDAIYCGLDFGFNDPACFLKCGWKDGDVYVLDEIYIREQTTNELIQIISEKFKKNLRITADSSAPSAIKEFKKQGFLKIKATKKGKDSIRAGIDWLRIRTIYINESCQNTINEITQYKYQEDKNGNVLEKPIDLNNHAMDALRYAVEPLRLQQKIKFLK